jgi:hypothetical protein
MKTLILSLVGIMANGGSRRYQQDKSYRNLTITESSKIGSLYVIQSGGPNPRNQLIQLMNYRLCGWSVACRGGMFMAGQAAIRDLGLGQGENALTHHEEDPAKDFGSYPYLCPELKFSSCFLSQKE